MSRFIVFALTVILAASCAKEIDSSVDIPKIKLSKMDPKIAEARKFFETNAEDLAYPDLAFQPGSTKTRAEDYGRSVSLRWGESTVVEGDDYEAVQVLLRDGIKHYAGKMIVRNGNISYEATFWFGYNVIKKYKMTGKREMYIFSVIPDADYYKKDVSAAEKLTFDQFENGYDGDFSGVILFSGLDGQVISGTRYVDGKVTHRQQAGRWIEEGGVHSHSHAHSGEACSHSHEASRPTFSMCLHLTKLDMTKGGGFDDDEEILNCIQDGLSEDDMMRYGWCEFCGEFHSAFDEPDPGDDEEPTCILDNNPNAKGWCEACGTTHGGTVIIKCPYEVDPAVWGGVFGTIWDYCNYCHKNHYMRRP